MPLFSYEWPGVRKSCSCINDDFEKYVNETAPNRDRGIFEIKETIDDYRREFDRQYALYKTQIFDGECMGTKVDKCETIPFHMPVKTNDIDGQLICGKIAHNSGEALSDHTYLGAVRPKVITDKPGPPLSKCPEGYTLCPGK